eukprot:Ihof_evm21s12 gene=Ihof_evmTU21s12
MDRKAELEKKRKKLEELRQAREAKQLAARSGDTTPVLERDKEKNKEKQDVSDLVSSLLGGPSSFATQATSTPMLSTSGLTTPSISSRSQSNIDLTSQPQPQPVTVAPVKLTTSDVIHINYPPLERVVYEKGAQTDDSLLDEAIRAGVTAQLQEIPDETISTSIGTGPDVTIDTEDQSANEKPVTVKPIALDDAQAQAIMQSDGFQSFFTRSSKIMERALQADYDVTVDYANDVDEGVADVQAGREITLFYAFSSDRYTKHRASSSLDWSPKYPELFLSSYTQNDVVASEPGGTVCVWNIHLKERPEFVFHWQSPMMSACFARFDPHLIVGGSYSGQVVLWDNRAKSAPVQRTTLSTRAHAHPIFGMEMVGTQHANNIITVSTDGRLCAWQLDMLAEPQDTIDIRGVAATSLSFPDNDVNSFVVGGEDGSVHIGSRLNSNAGTVQAQSIAGGHAGPVTSVDFHPTNGNTDFSDYILSSSTDWTIKLWSKSGKRLIHSFDEASDYVYCVQWSPVHPSVFASVDGTSRLCIWNINENTEVPVATVQVNKRGAAVNQLKWSADGRRIVVGDADGICSVYTVGE